MSEIDWGLLKSPPDIAGNYINAFRVGQGLAKEAQTRNALASYGTDPQGAVQSLMAVDPAQAMQLQQYGQQQSDRQAGIAAATSYAGGDIAGAKQSYAKAGNVQGMIALDQHIASLTTAQQEQAAKRSEILGNLAGALLNVPQKQRASVVAHMAPGLQAQGITPQEIQGFDLSDANLSSFRDAHLTAAERLQAATLAETTRHNKVEEGMPKPVTFSADQQVVNANPNSALAGAAPAAAGGAGGAPAGPAAPGGAAPRGVRNNNPLNVTALPQGKWDGQTGQDGQYAVFATPEAGMAAADKNLQAYANNHGINTLAGIITRWSPESENDTKGYIATVSKDLGVDPNQPLNMADPNVRSSILHSMAKVELGQSIPAASAPAAAAAAHGGTPPAASGTSLPVLATGTNFEAAKALTAAVQSGKTGTDLLAALPPAQAAQVKALAEGRLPFPSGMALKTPYWQNLIGVVSQYDPTFNAQDYNARNRTRLDFTSGPSARSMTALSTAINHGDEVLKTGEALGNVQIPIVGNAFNALKNTAAAAGGDPRVGNFKAAAQTYLTEVAKVLQGGPPHEGELNKAQQILNDANSPAQIQGAVKTIAGLLYGRFGPLIDQYNQGMGTVNTTPPSIKHSVWAAFQRQLGNAHGSAAPGSTSGGFKVLGVQ